MEDAFFGKPDMGMADVDDMPAPEPELASSETPPISRLQRLRKRLGERSALKPLEPDSFAQSPSGVQAPAKLQACVNAGAEQSAQGQTYDRSSCTSASAKA